MDTGKSGNISTERINAFWGESSDEDENIFDVPHVVKTVAIIEPRPKSKTLLPSHADERNSSPHTSLPASRMLTPFDIDSATSFDNSPSVSISNLVINQVNIPTPIPSPEHSPNTCGDICTNGFCIGLDETTITTNITPVSRKRFGNHHKLSNNVKRRCIRNIEKTFSPSQRSVTQVQSDVSATPSIASLPSSEDESDKNFNDNSSHNSDTESNCPSDTIESEVSTPRGAKKQLKGRDEWARNKRKRLKNLGQEYIRNDGKTVGKKIMRPPCNCRKLSCFDKINYLERNDIFQKFWNLGDRQKQWSFLVKYVKKVKKKRTLNQDTPNHRQFTFRYQLPLTEQGQGLQVAAVNVCKIMFINTLVISDKMIRTAWDKYDGSTEVEEDKRGRHNNHRKLITDDMIQSVVDHVKSLAPVESHYLRKKTKKLYLEGSPSIPRMFQLYNEWFDPDNYTTNAKTERQYREIVKENFNLGTFIPKKDQCNVCHAFRATKNPTEEEIEKQNEHQKNKVLAREKKENDKKEAIQSNGKIVAAVFDFEKILNSPHAKVSLLYYKRKLACLNFTVFDMGTKKAVCYMWDETVAKRGSNDVSSCLLDFIDSHVQRGVDTFRFWSDNCTGQNRNRIVFSLYVYAANKYNVNISHTFLEKGHTQNEGDSVHSTIEKASSLKTIYTPEEWRLLVRWARSPDHEPYLVKNMTQDIFYDFKSELNDRAWSINSEGDKIRWKRVREVFITKDDPFKVMFRYCLNDEYQYVIVRSRTRRQIAHVEVKKAYNGPLALTRAKYKDLMSLCREGIIPSEYVPFYEQLPTQNASNEQYPEPDYTDESEIETDDCRANDNSSKSFFGKIELSVYLKSAL